MTWTTRSVDLEPVSDDIASLVEQSRTAVMRAATVTLINLYWDICRPAARAKVGVKARWRRWQD